MKTYSIDKIKEILRLHSIWLINDPKGIRADLRYANLSYADLSYADLRYANLRYANLRYADLRYANLSYADLRYADLSFADLSESKFDDNELIVKIFFIGPIGSRKDYLQVYQTDKQVIIKAGCFSGSIAQFTKTVKEKHGDNEHGKHYLAAIKFIKEMVKP